MSKSYRQHFSWPTNLIDSVNGNYGFAELCIDPPLRLRIKLEFLQRPQIGRRWPRRALHGLRAERASRTVACPSRARGEIIDWSPSDGRLRRELHGQHRRVAPRVFDQRIRDTDYESDASRQRRTKPPIRGVASCQARDASRGVPPRNALARSLTKTRETSRSSRRTRRPR
jgi:hypothetical protein